MAGKERESSKFDSKGSSTRFSSDAFAGPSFELPDLKEERIEFLGRGGFGEVWRVKYLGAEEAWKYIPLEVTSSREIERETWIARQISHPNVVRYLDLRQVGDFFVIREDLVRGRDLRKLVDEEGILPESLVLHIAVQVAEALTVAHRSGVVHQDLKPQNILLRNDERTAMLTDFGLATLVSEDAIRGGTLHFMPPESLEGQVQPNPLQDIWSLGMTIYFLLTGRLPFRFESMESKDVIQTITTEELTPVRDYAPYVSDALCDLVSRMLSKDPDQRPADMADLLDDLERISDQIQCPDCGEYYSISAVVGDTCPNPECGQASILSKKESMDLLFEGNNCFAFAEYDMAKGYYKRLFEKEAEGVEFYAPKAQALYEEAERFAQNLEDWLATIQDQIESGKLLEAYESCRTAFRSHSRSKTLATAREGLLQKIRERYEAHEAAVDGHLKAAEFDQALAHLLEARDFLRLRDLGPSLVGGERKDLALRLKSALQNIKARKIKLDGNRMRYDEAMNLLRDRIAELDFEGARTKLVELQVEFDASSVISDMRDPLVRAAERWRMVDQGVLQRIGGFLSDKEAPRENTPVRRTLALLNEIVETVQAPCFKRVQITVPERLRGMVIDLEEAKASLRERVGEYSKLADACLEQKDLRGAVTHLEPLKAVAIRTDLLERDEADEIVQKTDRYLADIKRAGELFRSAKDHLAGRRYAEALTAFETTYALYPDLEEGLEEQLTGCRERLSELKREVERFEQLRGRLETLVEVDDAGAIDKGAAKEVSRDAGAFFKGMAGLVELGDDATTQEVLTQAGAVVERLLSFWSRYLTGHTGLTKRAARFEVLIQVINEIPDALWKHLEKESAADVRLAYSTPFAVLLQSLYEGVATAEDGTTETRFGYLETSMDRMEEIHRFVRVLMVRPEAEHPLSAVAGASVDVARSLSKEAESEEQRDKGLRRIQAVLQRAIQLVGKGVLSEPLDKAVREVEAELKKRMWSKAWRRLLKASVWILGASILALAFYGGYEFGSGDTAFLEQLPEDLKTAEGSMGAGDSAALLHTAALWSTYRNQIDEFGVSGAPATPEAIGERAGAVVQGILINEMGRLRKRLDASLTSTYTFDQELFRAGGRLKLVRDTLGHEFENLFTGDELTRVLAPIEEVEDRLSRILDHDAQSTNESLAGSWEKYRSGNRSRIHTVEKEIYDAYFWVKAQEAFLTSYEKMISPGLDGADPAVLAASEKDLGVALTMAADLFALLEREGSESGTPWQPVLDPFKKQEGESPGFLAMFEEVLRASE